jgi:hypothetical protein
MSLFVAATAAMMRCLNSWRSFGRGGTLTTFLTHPQPLHSCYRVSLRKLQDIERLLLWSRHFATWSPLAAVARNTFPRQLQTNFDGFPNNCCTSRDCRLAGYFIQTCESATFFSNCLVYAVILHIWTPARSTIWGRAVPWWQATRLTWAQSLKQKTNLARDRNTQR